LDRVGKCPSEERMFSIVFTDLDGTLLDHFTYDFSPALPALQALKDRRIPVVFCSSKTSVGMRALRRAMNNEDPFIVENGGGIYIPRGYFGSPIPSAREAEGYWILDLGEPCDKLRSVLEEIAKRNGLAVRHFLQMTPSELAAETGLTLEKAGMALQREYDLPFRLEQEERLAELDALIRAAGLKMSQGGRYLHITSDIDKASAIGRLLSLYREEGFQDIRTIGLGDSQNDRDMLEVLDWPIIIPNPHSKAPLPWFGSARMAERPGPEGWRRAILALLEETGIGNG
jgi:mannosyl-3-phosphoglycerate phosphatase